MLKFSRHSRKHSWVPFLASRCPLITFILGSRGRGGSESRVEKRCQTGSPRVPAPAFTSTGTQGLLLTRTHAWRRRNAPSKPETSLVLRPFLSYLHFLGDQLTATNVWVTLIPVPSSQVSLSTWIPVFKRLESLLNAQQLL